MALATIVKIFKAFFKKLGGLFRDGLDDFLITSLERGVFVGLDLLQQRGFGTGDEFFKALWPKLRLEFFGPHDTWLTILAGYVLEALKKKAQKDASTITGIEQNSWLRK